MTTNNNLTRGIHSHSGRQIVRRKAPRLLKGHMSKTVPEKTPETRWFTFGQVHTHFVTGITFDKDCVVKITAFSARKVMFDTFGTKWAMEYNEQPDLRYFPRGVIEL